MVSTEGLTPDPLGRESIKKQTIRKARRVGLTGSEMGGVRRRGVGCEVSRVRGRPRLGLKGAVTWSAYERP